MRHFYDQKKRDIVSSNLLARDERRSYRANLLHIRSERWKKERRAWVQQSGAVYSCVQGDVLWYTGAINYTQCLMIN